LGEATKSLVAERRRGLASPGIERKPLMSRTITKKELVSRIAEKTSQTKVVTKEVIQLFLDEIIGELGKGNRLEFREFGVFEIKERAARKAQNPRTLEKVYVPAKKVVKFKVGRLMKERVAAIAAEVERLERERIERERPKPPGFDITPSYD
jgi:nucleoid DNA-binding protein